MSDLHKQATELRNVAKQLQMFLAGQEAGRIAADVAQRAEQLLCELTRTVPQTSQPGPISYKSEWD